MNFIKIFARSAAVSYWVAFFLVAVSSCSKGGNKASAGNGGGTLPDTTKTGPGGPGTGTAKIQTPPFGNGVDLQPSYYNGGNVTFGWALMQQNPAIKTVRIEIEPGVPIALAASWIHQADSIGLKVIATYHKSVVLGSNDSTALDSAANWWKTNYAALLQQGGPFTINLMNEWGSHTLTANAYATDYNAAIAIVRTVYADSIILDCPGWGQEPNVAAQAIRGTGGITRLSDTRLIFSLHIYPGDYNGYMNRFLQSSDLDSLAATGSTCMIGEFGNSPAGPVDWSAIVAHAKSIGWPVLGWSWNGDGGTMNMVTPAWDSNADAGTYMESSYFTTIYSLL
jgi:hypothetical protein